MAAKKINFRLITVEDWPEPYKLMEEIRFDHHPDILKAKIELAWSLNVKADLDGHVVLGKCIKASDLQKELVDYDFCILLNKDVWESSEFTRDKQMALMDHELMHAQRATTSDGDPSVDERGRPVWSIRGHDIEEFGAIVRRYGCYKNDLEMFAQDLLRRRQNPLFETGGAVQEPGIAQSLQRLQERADQDGAKLTLIDPHGEAVLEITPTLKKGHKA